MHSQLSSVLDQEFLISTSLWLRRLWVSAGVRRVKMTWSWIHHPCGRP